MAKQPTPSIPSGRLRSRRGRHSCFEAGHSRLLSDVTDRSRHWPCNCPGVPATLCAPPGFPLPLGTGLSQFGESLQAKHTSHSSRHQSAPVVVGNATFGRTDLIMLLSSALVLWLMTEALFRRRK